MVTASTYLLALLDVTNTVELTQDDQEKFADFMSWVTNYNEYIINTYAEKASTKNDVALDDIETLTV